MAFVELHNWLDKPLNINIKQIINVTRGDDTTAITVCECGLLRVKESYIDVMQKIKDAERADYQPIVDAIKGLK